MSVRILRVTVLVGEYFERVVFVLAVAVLNVFNLSFKKLVSVLQFFDFEPRLFELVDGGDVFIFEFGTLLHDLLNPLLKLFVLLGVLGF